MNHRLVVTLSDTSESLGTRARDQESYARQDQTHAHLVRRAQENVL